MNCKQSLREFSHCSMNCVAKPRVNCNAERCIMEILPQRHHRWQFTKNFSFSIHAQ